MEKITITSGKYRGRKILTPGDKTHPMGAREKLALFNMIGETIVGAKVLDIFAGSGALGIEALSRGAGDVIFVEKNRKACQVIEQNLQNLGEKREVVADIASKYETEEKFDIILADPPYDNFRITEVADLGKFLKKGGLLALSHPDKAPDLAGLALFKTRQYARAKISLYGGGV